MALIETTPLRRDEIFMAAAAGEYVGELPEPATRQERYWKKIAQRIDEGSSVSPEAIDAAIEDYLNTHDADVVTEAELSDALSGKANASHMHAQSEVTGLESALSGKANASHIHAQSDVTGLETALLGKANASHTHDDRYYTETEIDTALSGKSNTGHTHDDRYYTEAEVDTLLSHVLSMILSITIPSPKHTPKPRSTARSARFRNLRSSRSIPFRFRIFRTPLSIC